MSIPTRPVESVARVVSEGSGSMEINLENTGYVVTTLQAGLYHGLIAETAEDAIIDAVMMGGDTDTLAAVAGAVAGDRFEKRFLHRRQHEFSEAAQLREYGNIHLQLIPEPLDSGSLSGCL